MAVKKQLAHAVGRRKTAVARVYLLQGSGVVTVNGRKFEDYFPIAEQRNELVSPLKTTGILTDFDVVVRVAGGGVNGQVGAVVHGLSRAICEYDSKYRSVLKPLSFLTRDSRMVERKKYGKRGARRSFQFSKR